MKGGISEHMEQMLHGANASLLSNSSNFKTDDANEEFAASTAVQEKVKH